MLRAFSSIRKSLINEGKTVRYLKYAVGEVLLIMVGIFMALQLNNWNEGRKNRVEEQQILRGLKVEFEGHLTTLNRRLVRIQKLNEDRWLFLSYLTEEDLQLSTAELDAGLYAILSGSTWDPATSVIDALLSSGRLYLVQDSELRSRLTSWKSVVDEVMDGQIVTRSLLTNTLWPLMGAKGLPLARGRGIIRPEFSDLVPETMADQQYSAIRGDQELISMISLKHNLNLNNVGEMTRTIQEAEEIISLIDQQIQ